MIEQFSDLLQDREGPCVSLYLPTRGYRTPQQAVMEYKQLLDQAGQSLAMEWPAEVIDALLAPLHELAENERFWAHTLTGLAVLRAPDFYKVYKLQRTVPERVIVADSFHLKPLLRIIQSADRFEVLALTREHVRFFHGNRDALDEVELHPNVPRTLEAALGDQVTTQHDTDTERFFRAVDRAIHEHHSKSSRLPLMIAALAEHHTTFRTLSHNTWLAIEGVIGNPDAFTLDELREKAWAAFEPRYHARLQRLLDEFGASRAHALGSDVVEDVALAALGGRIRTLLVDAELIIPGRVDRDTGQVQYGPLDDPRTDDVLDDLAELVLRMGGEVVMVPRDRMPTATGVAAIYRF